MTTVSQSPIPEKKPIRRKSVFLLSALTLAVAIVVLFPLRLVIKPRSVAFLTAPDGTEFCIAQKFNWSPELFTTNVYYRKPGMPWGCFYYDHRDSYWTRGEVALDAPKHLITITRDGRTTATFDYFTETFTLMKNDSYMRTVVGAQTWMPPEFNPPR